MNKITISLLLLLSAAVAESQNLPYNGVAKIYCRALGGEIGQMQFHDGFGTYNIEKDEGLQALVYITDLDKHRAHYMVLEKGTVTITVTKDTLIILGGTPNNEALGQLDRKMEPCRMGIEKLLRELKAAQNEKNKPREEKVLKELKELGSKYEGFQKEFALTGKNLAGLLYASKLADQYTTTELKQLLINYKDLSETPVYKSLDKRYQSFLRTDVGVKAPDFTQNDAEGRPVKLSDFRGKYVLLEFWASWCGPCRAEAPFLISNFDKYKDRNFTILSTSVDKPEDRGKWLKAIQDDKTSRWTQVSDLKGFENSAATLYGVQAIPLNFLLDPEGVIIAKNLRGEELGKKLKEIFE